MNTYAFIDVYNTESTTKKLLGFEIDWSKLITYLQQRWQCKDVYFYSGIAIGDTVTEMKYQIIEGYGYKMKVKQLMSYKRPDKTIEMSCSGCGKKNIKTIPMGYVNKSNCDVELTVDVLNHAKSDTNILIFTGAMGSLFSTF